MATLSISEEQKTFHSDRPALQIPKPTQEL